MATFTLAGTLGEYFKVSRGTVTGNRAFFVMTKRQANERGLLDWALPVIASTREFSTNAVLRDEPGRHVVIVVPADIERAKHPALDAWLKEGELTARPSKRTAWWTFGIKRPAACATYKGASGPRLIANPDRMVLLNIAYALEPKADMTAHGIEEFVRSFNSRMRPAGTLKALAMSTFEVASARV